MVGFARLFGFDTTQKQTLENYVADAVASAPGGDITASQITDSTAVGRSVLTAADAAAARTAIGAGTSNLAIGTTASTALAGNTAVPAAASTAPAALAAAAAVGVGTTYARADHVHAIPGVSVGAVRGTVLIQAAQANSTATDVAGLVTDFNALLAKLRTAGIIAP